MDRQRQRTWRRQRCQRPRVERDKPPPVRPSSGGAAPEPAPATPARASTVAAQPTKIQPPTAPRRSNATGSHIHGRRGNTANRFTIAPLVSVSPDQAHLPTKTGPMLISVSRALSTSADCCCSPRRNDVSARKPVPSVSTAQMPLSNDPAGRQLTLAKTIVFPSGDHVGDEAPGPTTWRRLLPLTFIT